MQEPRKWPLVLFLSIIFLPRISTLSRAVEIAASVKLLFGNRPLYKKQKRQKRSDDTSKGGGCE